MQDKIDSETGLGELVKELDSKVGFASLGRQSWLDNFFDSGRDIYGITNGGGEFYTDMMTEEGIEESGKIVYMEHKLSEGSADIFVYESVSVDHEGNEEWKAGKVTRIGNNSYHNTIDSKPL